MLHDRQSMKPSVRWLHNITACFLLIPTLFGLALVTGCGGGGGGGGGGVSGPTITMQGQVTDPFANTPAVPNATVALKGLGLSTTTDANGNYMLAGVPANSNVTFVVTDPAFPSNVYTSPSPVATGSATPQTQNIQYAFSLAPPPGG